MEKIKEENRAGNGDVRWRRDNRAEMNFASRIKGKATRDHGATQPRVSLAQWALIQNTKAERRREP